MTEQSLSRIWSMRIIFACVISAVLYFQLLPLDTVPRLWAGPDLVLLFACAWAFRRPEYVPIWGLALLFLLADMILLRPPGLWAALALLGCESLKSRASGLKDGGFAAEWLAVCLTLASVALAYRFALLLTLTETPGLGLSVFELIASMLCYPLVVAVTHGVLGVRKVSPGDLETIGGRS